MRPCRFDRREEREQVVERENPGHVALRVAKWEATKPTLCHTGRRLEHVDVLGGPLDVRGHDGFDDGVEWQSRAETTDRQVTVGDDAAHLPMRIDHDDAADLLLAHELANRPRGLRSTGMTPLAIS